jgi:hypothetical protein
MITEYKLIDARDTKTLLASLELLESTSIIDKLVDID